MHGNPFLCNNCFYSICAGICYLFYKIGTNKQTNSSTRCQSESWHGRQPGDSSTYPVTVNQSYGELTPAIPSTDEDPSQIIYEKM